MDEYAAVAKGALKLKMDEGIKKKKKKKNSGAKEVLQKVAQVAAKEIESMASNSETSKPGLTKAEKAFQKKQEKRQMERVLEKASKTHKQRVEEFNNHLDSLTEHYDIPKVSWTK